MTLPDAKHLAKILGIILAFIVILGGSIYLFTMGMLNVLGSMKDDLAKAIITAAIAVLGSAFTLAFGKLWEQRTKIRDEIRAKKIPIYEAHIASFFKVFLGGKPGVDKPSDADTAKAFAEFAERMVTWGSSDVIKAWGNFRKMGSDLNKLSDPQKLDLLDNIFLAIRKDVGNDVQTLGKRDLLRLFINDVPPK